MQAAEASPSGAHTHHFSRSSCVRMRNRPILQPKAGVGKVCPKIQQFTNCPCNFGTRAAQTTFAVGESVRNISRWNVTGWDSLRTQAQQLLALQGQLGVDVLASMAGVSLLFFCLCIGCCCWLSTKTRGKKKKVLSSSDEGMAKKGMNGSNGREANDEDDSNDRTTLLSERTSAYKTAARLAHYGSPAYSEQPPIDWQKEQKARDRPLEKSMWQEADSQYGPLSKFRTGYPDSGPPKVNQNVTFGVPHGDPDYAIRAGGFVAAAGAYSVSLASAYAAGPGASYNAPPQARARSRGLDGGYAGGFADNAPFGGLLDPNITPAYMDNRTGGQPPHLLDFAPQPIQPPPPQYYQQYYEQARANSRGLAGADCPALY